MKNILLKILKIIGSLLLILVVGLLIAVYFTGPALPENTDIVIENVLKNEPKEYVNGEAGYIISDKMNIWYENISPKDSIKGSVLLFMGIANDALGWPPNFIDRLVNSGYQVIRYDYRSTGNSDWVGDYSKSPFSLSDLAKDATIIIDSLDIDKVHLVGVSLGGMVAQDFAINYPKRTNTLTSIMSSGNIIDPELPSISKSTLFKLIKVGIKYGLSGSVENNIKLHIAARIILRGEADYKIDINSIANQVYYNIKNRKGYNPKASEQHQKATLKSGSRYDKLKQLDFPILLIHGENDPLISIEHSKKLAKIIPSAKTKWFNNMGHDLPGEFIDSVSQELINIFEIN